MADLFYLDGQKAMAGDLIVVAVNRGMNAKKGAQTLGIGLDECWDKVWDWAEKYGFRVADEKVIFAGGQVDAFIDQLEQNFKDWQASGTGQKKGKLQSIR